MFTEIIRRHFAAAGALVLGVGVGWIPMTNGAFAASFVGKETLHNLQIAYDSECNTEARYLAFAERADAEGFKQVAILFRAAAKAEAIHAETHAASIRGMGGEPKTTIRTPEVKTTRENLEAARNCEIFDHEAMYTEFLGEAKSIGNDRAVRTLSLTKMAEASHLKLYQLALDELQSWRDGKRTFYVCDVCGFTVTGKAPAICPSCDAKKEMFVAVK